MKIGIFGRGRLGGAIAQAAGTDVAWQVGRDPAPDRSVDVAIDASAGPAVAGHLQWALDHGVAFVIGTTGWDIPDLAARVGSRIGVVVAPNFSLTVALLAKLTRVLARVVLEACPRKTAVAIPHEGSIRPSDLCVSSIRAGTTGANSHTVTIEAPEESLLVRHEGRTSAAYAAGALAACRWIASKRGVFTMNDVARDVLDPLFRENAP